MSCLDDKLVTQDYTVIEYNTSVFCMWLFIFSLPAAVRGRVGTSRGVEFYWGDHKGGIALI